MKNILNIITVLVIQLIFFGCSNNSDYLNGDVSTINTPISTDTLIGEKIILDGLYTGKFSVYDSLMFFVSQKFPLNLVSVFSLNSLKQIASLCQKGNGPDESSFITHYKQFELRKSNIHLWVDNNHSALSSLNLSQSIKNKTTIYDSTKIKLNWTKDFKIPFLYAFALDDEHYIVKNQAKDSPSNNIEYIPGAYNIFDRKSNKPIQTVVLFKKPIINKFNESKLLYPKEIYFSSIDGIKPDHTKIAMAMVRLSQINILDLKSNKLRGYRLKNTQDFEYLTKDPNEFITFHRDISVDNDFIYVSFVNIKKDKKRNPINLIHIYNWNGEFVKRLFLNKSFINMTIDSKNKIIYTLDENDEIYKYDMNFLF